MPIVRGDKNPLLSTVGFLVGLFEGKFHGNSVGDERGGAVEDDIGAAEGVGVSVDGAKVGTCGYDCAFATGAIATTEVNMPRTNNARVTLAKFSFKPKGDFSNIDLARISMNLLQI